MPMVCRWAQELLGYHLSIVHISNTMMVYVDALIRRFGHLISNHIYIAALLSSWDWYKHPRAYAATKFSNLGNVDITQTDNPYRNPTPFLTSDVIPWSYQDSTNNLSTSS